MVATLPVQEQLWMLVILMLPLSRDRSMQYVVQNWHPVGLWKLYESHVDSAINLLK